MDKALESLLANERVLCLVRWEKNVTVLVFVEGLLCLTATVFVTVIVK
jgi:hypothetical protein